jgi:NADH:ubiquinone oxidoreductase subunit
MKKFPQIVHMAFEENADGEDDYLAVYTDGIDSLEPGQRCAIYKRIEEGTVRGPKSFVSKKRNRR